MPAVYEWRCGVATFGKIERTSALAHLVDPSERTLCGATLAASRREPGDGRRIRCQRCMDARSRGE